ncbi:MAG: flavin reductase [Prevotella sp.]|nr:flavin reductase [Prevotella sp.]MDY5665680.1 flavin reductase [Alloprevotella sp.]
MKEVTIETLAHENAFELIGKEWMLVTAGTKDNFNMMTASWGGIGWLWNKPVAFIFIRPERYTYPLIEQNEHLTLSFLGNDEAARKIYNFCGSKSGRDYDKVKETGLQAIETAHGAITYEQARLTIEGRKMFRSAFKPEDFLDKEALTRWYNDQPGGSLHTMYIVEIEKVYVK